MSKQAFKRVRRALEMEVCRKPLDAYAWPGGYPMYYHARDGGVFCPSCVNKEIERVDQSIKEYAAHGTDDGFAVYAADANYEDASLFCDHCNAQIEAAYLTDQELAQGTREE